MSSSVGSWPAMSRSPRRSILDRENGSGTSGECANESGYATRIAGRMAPRRVPDPPGLRARTARGGVVNAAFLSGAELLVLLQGLLATALLGPDAIGLYGIVTTTAMTIVALRRVGIDEAFVQTDADDEEAEFQRALTVELALGLLGALAVAALAPVLAAAYDDSRLLGLTLAVTYLPVAFALQAPQWVFFKRMEYVRLRVLQAIVPLG